LSFSVFHDMPASSNKSYVSIKQSKLLDSGRAMQVNRVTHGNVHVDRIARSWLTEPFVDPAARSLFVPSGKVQGTAAKEKTIILAYEVGLSHKEDKCSSDATEKQTHLHDALYAFCRSGLIRQKCGSQPERPDSRRNQESLRKSDGSSS